MIVITTKIIVIMMVARINICYIHTYIHTWMVVRIRVPFLGTLNNRCRIIIGTPKGTILLTTHPYKKRRFIAEGLGMWL